MHSVSPRRHFSCVFGLWLLLSVGLAGQVLSPSPTQGGSIYGVVKSGNMPVPGVTVTATNSTTAKKVITWTDVDGSYTLAIPDDGRYVLRTQMAAFAAATQEVIIGSANRKAQANLELVLLSRVPSTQPAEPRQAATNRTAGNRGFQSMRVTQGEGSDDSTGNGTDQIAPAGMPVPGIAPNTATESVAVSGNTSNPMGQLNGDEFRQRMDDIGGPGGQGGGGFGGGGFAGGGFGGGLEEARVVGAVFAGVDSIATSLTAASITPSAILLWARLRIP